MDQRKRKQTQGKRHTVVRCGRPQAEQSGNIAYQNKNKYRSDIVCKLHGILSHYIVNHAVQLLDNHLHNILEASGHF